MDGDGGSMSPGEFGIAVTFQEEGQQVEILEPVAEDALGQVTRLKHLLSQDFLASPLEVLRNLSVRYTNKIGEVRFTG